MCTLDSCFVLTRTDLGLAFDATRFDQFHCFVEDYCLQCHADGSRRVGRARGRVARERDVQRARLALGRIRPLPEAARQEVAQTIPEPDDRMTDDHSPLFRVRRKVGISLFRLRRRVERTPPPPVLDERERRVVDAFHRLYYDRHETTWTSTTWLGTTVLKCPLDLWNYQEILVETRPDLIIETGTHLGGSALYLAGICDLIGNGRIVTVDIEDRPGRPVHGRIIYLEGSSTSDEVRRAASPGSRRTPSG